MWHKVRPLAVGYAISLAIFVFCFWLMQEVIANTPDDAVPQIGLELYFGWAFVMLFLPAFSAGYSAARSGALYGLALSLPPIVLFAAVNEGFPMLGYLMWVAVAVVGGHIGQQVASRKHPL